MTGIVYAAVTRRSVVLVSNDKSFNDLDVISGSVLPQIPTYNTKTAYTLEGYEFLVVVHDGLTFMCAIKPEFGKRQAFQFLEEAKEKFCSGSLVFRAINAVDHELDKDFASVLDNLMNKFNRGEGDSLAKLQNQVQEVTGVMKNNIEKVLDRGDKIDSLLDKTTNLEASSGQFFTSSRKLRRKMWCKNVKMWIILAVVIISILTLIILFSTNVIPIHGSSSSDSSSVTKKP